MFNIINLLLLTLILFYYSCYFLETLLIVFSFWLLFVYILIPYQLVNVVQPLNQFVQLCMLTYHLLKFATKYVVPTEIGKVLVQEFTKNILLLLFNFNFLQLFSYLIKAIFIYFFTLCQQI